MIARIYREGIEDRIATFETDAPSEEDVLAWFERPHPIVVVSEADKVFAFAVSAPTSTRPCYAGNAEFSVYVARTSRGRGGGRDAMAALIDACRVAGYNKLSTATRN
jgi:phosphinothricin acetyltransferase